MLVSTGPLKRPAVWLVLGAILLLVGCSDAEPSPTAWEAANRGLTGHAEVTSLARNPAEPDTIYAGLYARDGLYISQDSGASWAPLAVANSPTGVLGRPVFSLLADGDTLWAGTPNGLYALTFPPGQGASQVERVDAWPRGMAVFHLAQDAAGQIYAAGEHAPDHRPALWRRDQARTWQPLAPLPDQVPDGAAVLAVAVTPDGVILAGTDGHGLFRSSDDGRSWQQAQEIGATFVAAFLVIPQDQESVILARTRRGLFRSADQGERWQQTAATVEERMDALTLLPDGTPLLGLSNGALLAGSADGAAWAPWGAPLPRDGLFHALLPLANSAHAGDDRFTLLAGAQSGLYVSNEIVCPARECAATTGLSWQPARPAAGSPLAAGVGAPRTTAVAQLADGVLFVGTEQGVYRSTDQGRRWSWAGDGLPPRAVRDLAVGPGQDGAGQVLYAGTEGGVYRSTDEGAWWTPLGWTDRSVPGVAADPAQPGRLYIRLAFERIYSADGALGPPDDVEWIARWEGMETTTEVLSMAVDPHDPAVVFAGGAVDFFRSSDLATRWQPVGTIMAGQSIFAVAVDPHRPGRVYAGATKGLYRQDAGAAAAEDDAVQTGADPGGVWQPVDDATFGQMTIRALAFHPTNPDLLVAGGRYAGLYRSRDGGATWHAMEPPADAAAFTVNDLAISADGRYLYVATEEGFWRARLD